MTLDTIKFNSEEINYITPSWDKMQKLAFEMAQEMVKNGDKFDRIVTLAKGGWPMTRSLVDFLQVSKVASIGVKFYDGINEKLDKPSIYQDLPISVKGENILLFDDVADTGESLEFVMEYLKTKEVGKITTATLFYKPHSKIKPDYYGAETSDWIIFPYDVVEGIKILGAKWIKQGVGESEIKNRFKELGFGEEVVEWCFSMGYLVLGI